MIGDTPSEEMADTELCIESSPMWPGMLALETVRISRLMAVTNHVHSQ
jgi:hypothetical protein